MHDGNASSHSLQIFVCVDQDKPHFTIYLTIILPHAHSRNDFLLLWKLSRSGDEDKVQEQIEESDAVARNLVNFKHHRKGTTPLMEAAACRCGEPVVAKLIAAGADVNDVDDTRVKNTALHYAATTNRDSLATETLLEAGADAFAVNRKGFTPLDVARQNGRKAVGAVLMDHMKVHAGWLYLRGKFRWQKRWAVVVACNRQRTSTELCIFRRPGDLRPDLVMLIDEAARMAHFPSTDSYSWLKRDNAFVFDKPVMCHRVKGRKFTRAPICRKTMSLDDVQTLHYVFAADSLNNLAQWRRVLQNSNFCSRESRSSLYRTSLVETQNGELYYWPHELVENLRNSILKEQEQQREEANDPLYQRLRETLEQRQPEPASNAITEQAHEPPTQPLLLHFKPTQPVKYVEVPLAAQQPYTDDQETNSSVSIITGSEFDTAGPEFATGIMLLTDSESQASQPQQSSNQEQEDNNQDKDIEPQSQRERSPQPTESSGEQERQSFESQPDLCGICDVARRNAICTPCGHQAGCTGCLKTIMRTSKDCPICHAPVRSVLKVHD
ncbi:Ankyrin repeat-containing domain [Phytophthora cactorum]|nr:Ankyrin repeat-containing domain [Phytophthora cactorum]